MEGKVQAAVQSHCHGGRGGAEKVRGGAQQEQAAGQQILTGKMMMYDCNCNDDVRL